MKVSVVIPARWGSQRLEGKVLADIGGKPMLQHTWERVMGMSQATEVMVAVDSDNVKAAAESWGAKVLMTDSTCQSGTERIASILPELTGDLILNVQADECFIEPELLDSMVEAFGESQWDIITPVCKLDDYADLVSPSVVKAVVGEGGRILYFSRSPVPHIRDLSMEEWLERGCHYQHIGVYGYSRETLEAYGDLNETYLESVERLEQLKFMDAGWTFGAYETSYKSIGVDTQEDLEKARLTMKVEV